MEYEVWEYGSGGVEEWRRVCLALKKVDS